MFDRILLALDDSPAGEMAALFAGALARRTGASVHVLHVNQRVVGANGLTLRTRSEATELVTLAVQDLADTGVRANGSVRVSSYRGVPRQIVAVAASARPTPSCSAPTATAGWVACTRRGCGIAPRV